MDVRHACVPGNIFLFYQWTQWASQRYCLKSKSESFQKGKEPSSPRSGTRSQEATPDRPMLVVTDGPALLWSRQRGMEGGAASDQLAAGWLALWGLSKHQGLFRTFSWSRPGDKTGGSR